MRFSQAEECAAVGQRAQSERLLQVERAMEAAKEGIALAVLSRVADVAVATAFAGERKSSKSPVITWVGLT